MGFLKSPLFNGLSARYQRLAQGEGAASNQDAPGRDVGMAEKVRDVVVRSSMRARAFIFGGVFFMLVILLGGRWYNVPKSEVSDVKVEPTAQYLHLLVTSPKPSLPSCRFLVSAGTNYYPTPNMVSWESSFNASADPPTSASIVKIETTLDFLQAMGSDRDADVVVIPDPEGSVLQLRPDVLLERYFEMIRTGQERARAGMSQADQQNVNHKIIFAASKRCSLGADEPACYAVPESPLPANVYGRNTDQINDKDEYPHLYVRERYLSTSFVMGELQHVKSLYEKVLELLKADPTKATEQEVIARIFGEQEYVRDLLREKNLPDANSRKTSFFSFLGFGASKPKATPTDRQKKPDLKPDTNYDFGIALDYEGLLAREDPGPKAMGFVVHNNSASVRTARALAGVETAGFNPLPQDIDRSIPPFWSRVPAWDGYPFRLGWKDVPLYTNLWSGAIPASIHHSYASSSLIPSKVNHKAGEKKPEIEEAEKKELLANLETSTWTNLWFYAHVRQKLNDYATSPDRPFTTLRGAGRQTAWWSIWREKWMLRRSKRWPDDEQKERKEWVEWAEVCDAFWGEVLAEGDGRGEGWKVPVNDW